MSKKRILFFTPTLQRTGSEMALFNLISNSSDDFEMFVVTIIEGELVFKLPTGVGHKSFGSYSNLIENNKPLFRKAINKVFYKYSNDEIMFKEMERLFPSDIWYINTIMFTRIIECAKANKMQTILHIHELEQMFIHLTDLQLKNTVKDPSLIIACSNACADVLKKSGRKEKIEVCYPANNLAGITDDKQKTKQLREKFKLDNDNFLWAMSGTMDINKNPSLFVDIANRLLKKTQKVFFMWIIQGNEDNGYVAYCKNKAIVLGIDEHIIWVSNPGNEYYDYLNSADGFVLTSTKESFSMVTVEALYLGKPVVSFDCGGVKEIVNEKTGIIIEGYNENEMVMAMLKIMNKEFEFNASLAKLSVEKFNDMLQKDLWKSIIDKYFCEPFEK